MPVLEVWGDLLEQPVQAIVNAYNRNIIPWWLLIPQGVSGAIRKRAGTQPFKELARHGPIPLGEAVLTGAGRLPFEAIIHVAGIDMTWRASERSIRASVQSALRVTQAAQLSSVALPMIGAGTGGGDEETVLGWMKEELAGIAYDGEVRLVRYRSA